MKLHEIYEAGADTSWTRDDETLTLNQVLGMTKHIRQVALPIDDKLKSKLIDWPGNPEEIERINQVTVSQAFPILVILDQQGNIYSILDGNHRLHKAIKAGAKTIPAKVIKPTDLNDMAKRVLGIIQEAPFSNALKTAGDIARQALFGPDSETTKRVKTVFSPKAVSSKLQPQITLDPKKRQQQQKFTGDVKVVVDIIKNADPSAKFKDIIEVTLENNNKLVFGHFNTSVANWKEFAYTSTGIKQPFGSAVTSKKLIYKDLLQPGGMKIDDEQNKHVGYLRLGVTKPLDQIKKDLHSFFGNDFQNNVTMAKTVKQIIK